MSTAAALAGTYGLQAVIDDTTPIYVRDDTPTAESRYRARFSFDPNSATLPSGEDHDILDGRTASATVFRIQLLFVNGAYHLRAKVRNDAGVDTNTTSFPITDAPHLIEAHWQAASAPGANDGALSLWLDGVLRQTVTGLDNDTLRIEQARLGPSGSLNAGTSGTEYFDAFEWGRQTVIGDVLFADGFESGNSLAWSAAVTDSGDLSVTTGAALVGTYGLQAVIDDTTPIYVEDDTPAAEPRYRARFSFDPNSVTLPSGEDHDILAGRTSNSAVFRVQVALVGGAYQVRAKIRDDAGADASSADYALSDAAHFVEVDWAAASAPGANNGYLSLWLDGVLKETKSGIDNDTLRIERARLGPSGSLNAGTSGTEYFDAFESREQTYIGPVGGSSGESSLVTATITYTYDPLYRLAGANYSGGYTYTFAYRYDAVGNRTVQTRTITSTLATTYTYDAANRLTHAGGVAYTWNATGNLLNDGNATYAYDFENRLISTTLSGVNTQFGYNGDGIRLRLIEAGALTTYTQDYAAPLPVVVQAKTGSASTQYVYSLGTRPVAEYEAATWEYLLADPLGSVRQLTDSSGNVTLLKSYEPYGSVLNSQGSATSIFGYAGEQTDTTGLVYLRARYMQPRLGVFLSRDAWPGDVMRPGSMNGWNYVEGNPINATDPTGLWRWQRPSHFFHQPAEDWYERPSPRNRQLEYRINFPNELDELRDALDAEFKIVDMFNSFSGDVYEIEPHYLADVLDLTGQHGQIQAYINARLLDMLSQNGYLDGYDPRFGHYDWNGTHFILGDGSDWPGRLEIDFAGLAKYVADYHKPGVVKYWFEPGPGGIALAILAVYARWGTKPSKKMFDEPGGVTAALKSFVIAELECEALVSLNGQITLVEILGEKSPLADYKLLDALPTDYGFLLVNPYEELGAREFVDDMWFEGDNDDTDSLWDWLP